MDYFHAHLEVKAVQAQQRIIAGYAAGIGNEDRVQDVIAPGAFTKTLASKAPAAVGVFIGHQTDSLPVGLPLVIRETPQGLYTETLIKPGPAGDDLLATAEFLQRHGKALGMSIGYRVHPGGASLERGPSGKTYRKLTSVDLLEYSYAAAQSIANEAALVTGVKAMKYTITHEGAEYVLRDADGEVEGKYPTQAAAEAERARLMRDGDEPETPGNAGKTLDGEVLVKAIWDTAYQNSLPDSAFLFIEAGGEQEDGKTTPRSKRHFPVRDASGALDATHLRNAIARMPQSTVPGLDAAALQGRARRLLANLDGGSKTVDTETPEWQRGVVPLVYGAASELLELPAEIATGQKALRDLDLDTREGQAMRPAEIARLDAIIGRLQVASNMAKLEASGQYAKGRSVRWEHELDLLALGV